jgi:hypothetical protein
MERGHVFITGELPLFMHDPARVQLAVVDGLGLAGQWTVTVDEHSQLVPFIVDDQEVDVFRELATENTSLWIIPQSKKAKSIVTVLSGESEYRGIYGGLYTYKHQSANHGFVVEANSKKAELTLPACIAVTSVTIDLRTWPVVYGPNTVANSVKVPQWLDRIKKQINVTRN